MPIARSFENNNRVAEWTTMINEIPTQYGLFNGLGVFAEKSTPETTVQFDRQEDDIRLPAPVNRGSREAVYGLVGSSETFNMDLQFYKINEYVTDQDVRGWRRLGTADQEKMLGDVIADKLTRSRRQIDQLLEYQKIMAARGLIAKSDGTTDSVFSAYGISQTSIDFVLGTDTTDIDAKINELKNTLIEESKLGSVPNVPEVYCDQTFFNALVSHPNVRSSYQYYMNQGNQRLRDDLARYYSWGVSEVFEHRGIRFVSYSPSFTLPDGSTGTPMPTGEGFTVVQGVPDSYEHWMGPSDKLSDLGVMGQRMYTFQYRDAFDEFELLQTEMSPLVVLRRPQISIRVHSSN